MAPKLSVTRRLKFDVPAVVGVPAIAPVPAVRVNPAGSEPLKSDQVYPGVPPVAAAVCEYPMPTVPPANDAVVIVGAAAITIDNAFVPTAPRVSVALSVKLNVDATVGVPVIAPPLLRLSPLGNAPALTAHVSAPVPPVATAVCE